MEDTIKKDLLLFKKCISEGQISFHQPTSLDLQIYLYTMMNNIDKLKNIMYFI